MKSIVKKIILILGIVVGLAAIGIGSYLAYAKQPIKNEQEIKIQQIINTPEFQQKIRNEAEIIYYKQIKQETDKKLLELKEKGFSGEKVSMLQKFLQKYNPDLAKYAHEIVKLPRWIEVVAIAGVETTFCNYGVGDSKNNCGAIINKETGKFKVYAEPLDSMKDIAYLLQKDMYRNKSIEEMNGLYCIDENSKDGTCKDWDEKVMKIINELTT